MQTPPDDDYVVDGYASPVGAKRSALTPQSSPGGVGDWETVAASEAAAPSGSGDGSATAAATAAGGDAAAATAAADAASSPMVTLRVRTPSGKEVPMTVSAAENIAVIRQNLVDVLEVCCETSYELQVRWLRSCDILLTLRASVPRPPCVGRACGRHFMVACPAPC
jgi:hypothetical protein